MRRKPSRPTRKKIPVHRSMYDSISGEEILKILAEADDQGVEPKDVLLHIETYWDDCEHAFKWDRPETDEEYQVRLEKYKKDLQKWKDWATKNKEKIDKYEQEQRAKAIEEAEHQQRMAEKEKRRRLKKLEKELAVLKKEVGE